MLDTPDGLLGDVGHVESYLIRLERVLVSVQDRCTICAERTTGLEIVLDAPDGTIDDVHHVESRFGLLGERVIVSVQDKCTFSIKQTIGSEIILNEPDGTPS
jgi:hypothetical protein